MPLTALSPSPNPKLLWELHLFDSVRNGPIVVGSGLTLKKAERLVTKFEVLIKKYRQWEGYGGEVGCFQMDEIFIEVRELAGAEFEILGDVSFLLVNREANETWNIGEGTLSLVKAS